MKKYEFTDDFCSEFARALADKINGRDYWSGYLDFSFDNVDVMFNSSLVIEHATCMDEEFAGCRMISRVTPVWWTIEVSVDGEDCDHDFSFDNVREFLEW